MYSRLFGIESRRVSSLLTLPLGKHPILIELGGLSEPARSLRKEYL